MEGHLQMCHFRLLFFCYLEDNGKLDPTSELDLYQPKINDSLKSFMDGWNNHALTTEHNMTPMQLFTSGVLMNDVDLTGIPDSENLGSGILEAPSVAIPDTVNLLTTQQLVDLRLSISRQSDSGSNYNIDSYMLVRRYVNDNVSQ